MILCKNCRHSNTEGTLYCDYCGINLITDSVTHMDEVTAEPDDLRNSVKWGTAHLSNGHSLRLQFTDTGKTMMLHPSGRLIFGRTDETTNTIPDVDLAPYGAISKGVSRRHALLEVNEDTIIIMDMGSSNGTYLNGQRLLPNQPRVLRDGDEVRLGRLITHIHFK